MPQEPREIGNCTFWSPSTTKTTQINKINEFYFEQASSEKMQDACNGTSFSGFVHQTERMITDNDHRNFNRIKMGN